MAENKIKMNVLTIGNQDFEIHDESAHDRIDEFGNVPFITLEEDADLELPVHRINDEEVDEESTWSSSKISSELEEGIGDLEEDISGLETQIRNIKDWTVAGTYTGRESVNVSRFKELMILIQIIEDSTRYVKIPVFLPVTGDVFTLNKYTVITYAWTSFSDGYTAFKCSATDPSTFMIELHGAYNQTNDITSTAKWTILGR